MHESGWLIESGANPPTYWDGRRSSHNVETFTADHAEAVRFARFEDAERVRCWLLQEHGHLCKSVEHMWVPAPPASTAGATMSTATAASLNV